jgi:hypothetical protein
MISGIVDHGAVIKIALGRRRLNAALRGTLQARSLSLEPCPQARSLVFSKRSSTNAKFSPDIAS